MRLAEIFINPPRDEFNINYLHFFAAATTVNQIHGLLLKRVIDGEDIRYGLIDPTHNILVSYLHLIKEPNFYQVSMPSTDPRYRRQGWATYLYDYAVLTDQLTIASDLSQTPHAQLLWKALIRNHRYNIYTLDKKTGEKQLYDIKNDPWNSNYGQENIILITEQFLPIVLEQIEQSSCRRGIRALRRQLGRDHFYGIGTSNELFENV